MSVRFAPSPTGRFHIGNLRTAWISRFWARRLGLRWVVRIEDIDGPRVVVGAAERQLSDLRELGMVPDEVLVQTSRKSRHWGLFLEAVRQGRVYPCFCSRKEALEAVNQAASAPHGESPLYSGRCRNRKFSLEGEGPSHPTLAWRFRNTDDSTGGQDFIVARTGPLGRGGLKDPDSASFTPSYNWACAIDDLEEGHSLLVRAWDLAHVVPHQRQVQRWLSGENALPAIFHCALVTGEAGERLEKRTRGVTLPELRVAGHEPANLLRAFEMSFAGEERDFAPGEVWGEKLRTVALRELLPLKG